MGLAVSCLAFCARGLLAEGTIRTKGAGKTPQSSAAPNTSKELRSPSRSAGPGRVRQAVDDGEPAADEGIELPGGFRPESVVSPGGLSSTINLMVVLTVLSLAPSILIMTTCFIRFIIVISLLRQAMGTQQLPPNQVLIALCLFLTFLVMSPVWQASYDEGIRPYTNPASDEATPTLAQTFTNTARPIRQFMFEQIEKAGNEDALWLFLDYQLPEADGEAREVRYANLRYKDVPLPALASAYILSELKVAFIIGFQIFLPFLVIDMVVSTVLMSMGMMMLPPTLVSFPFKLLLFVLIDGWVLVVGMLLESVRSSA
ncbi:MAG: flagellar type III secretion system pore protein FliP [Planctomycetia bacterium]|nr:flagellar type III secretion system pore protein FliP [Planctomycetia bacterium]